MKHTPGPWRYCRTHQMSEYAWFVIIDKEGRGPIFEAGGKDQDGQIAEAKYLVTDPVVIEANARLIAAAPEMLEALSEIVAEWSKGGYMRDAFPNLADTVGITMARAAIAKAEGDEE